MKKLLLTAVLAVGALLTGAGQGNAAYLITVTTPGTPNAGDISITNASGVPSTVSTYTGSLSMTVGAAFPNQSIVSLATSGNPVLTSAQTSSPYGSIFSQLLSSFTISNVAFTTGIEIPTVIVTISQNAYSFSGVQNNLATEFTVSRSGSLSSSGQTVSHSVTAGSSTVSAGSVSFTGSSPTSGSAGGRGAFAGGPNSITQVFTITNFTAGQSLTFNTNSTVGTPLPATAIGMLAGLPLLGLGGYMRRRFTA